MLAPFRKAARAGRQVYKGGLHSPCYRIRYKANALLNASTVPSVFTLKPDDLPLLVRDCLFVRLHISLSACIIADPHI
jgi:hypothetical protein